MNSQLIMKKAFCLFSISKFQGWDVAAVNKNVFPTRYLNIASLTKPEKNCLISDLIKEKSTMLYSVRLYSKERYDCSVVNCKIMIEN